MKDEKNFETSPLNTQDAKAEAATTLAPDATNGDKIKALRTAQHMSMAELARRASMSDRAIRYIESNQREPSVEAIQKIAAALGSRPTTLWMMPPSRRNSAMTSSMQMYEKSMVPAALHRQKK